MQIAIIMFDFSHKFFVTPQLDSVVQLQSAFSYLERLRAVELVYDLETKMRYGYKCEEANAFDSNSKFSRLAEN